MENTLLERIVENNNLNDFIFELANEVYNKVPEGDDFYNHIPIFNIQQALSFVIVIIDTLNKEFSTNTSVENLITEISKNENKIDIRFVQNGNAIKVIVFNTGDPIPEEDIEKVWIKFYKVDKARTREYGGSGIGLSIVKAIMDSMHQQCGVRNYTNGVAFWFTLESGGSSIEEDCNLL